jgi:hypothetical protein
VRFSRDGVGRSRYSTSSLDWIPGGGDQFGMFSIVWDHYEKSGFNNGIGVGVGFHFLAGPKQTDMPPRVFDFSIGYQIRQRVGPLAFDLAAAVMASSDLFQRVAPDAYAHYWPGAPFIGMAWPMGIVVYGIGAGKVGQYGPFVA